MWPTYLDDDFNISSNSETNYLEHTTYSQFLIKTQGMFLLGEWIFLFGILYREIFVFLSYVFRITADPISGNLFDISKLYFSSSDILNLSFRVSITSKWFSQLQDAHIR